MEQQTSAPEVLFERSGALGHVILNRPKAINALTLGMVTAITDQLEEWAADDAIATVLLTGAGERGLCAGGDIVGLYRAATGGDAGAAAAFLASEFALDLLISRYPKPFVAIMDGLVLGGGVGLSVHASHRVVTERSSVGLPEVAIGYVPDVGSTYVLARAPGELGTHLALTGDPVGPGDAIALGLADVFMPSGALGTLHGLLESTEPAEALAAVTEDPPPDGLIQQREWVDTAYAGDDARAVLERLRDHPDPRAQEAAAVLGTRSPTSLAVTLVALRRAAEAADLAAVLQQDYRICLHAVTTPDFAAGVKAQLITKTRTPVWDPAAIPAPHEVLHFFEPVDGEPRFT